MRLRPDPAAGPGPFAILRGRPLLVLAGAVAAAIAASPSAADPSAAGLRLVDSGAWGLRLVLEVEDGIGPGGRGLTAPGLPRAVGPGGVGLPYVAALVAAPAGARLRLAVKSEAHEDYSGVEAAAADSHAVVLDPRQVAALAHTEPLGRLRGTPAHRLRLFPWQVDPVTGRIRVHRRLLVDVTFHGGGAHRPAPIPDPHGDLLRGAFINPPPSAWAAPHPAARPAAADGWYDPALPWIKVLVPADGVYRITPAWEPLSHLGAESIDPRTFRLFHVGAEIPLVVRGEGDGSFDAGDEILLYGRYRRAVTAGQERDHESEYGPEETYWLTWGGAPGRRYEEREVSPDRGYPEREWYVHAAHHEIDRSFDQLGFATDPHLDRWFWQPPQDALTATHPDKPSSQSFAGDITALYEEQEYEARVEVALQGRTGEGFGEHHTVVHFNWTGTGSRVLEEAYWAGQVRRVIDASVPSRWLQPRNRVLLQGYADSIKVDQIWFNWFRVTYRRRFDAHPGFLAAPVKAAPEGHRITVEGFGHPEVVLLDAANGVLLTGAAVTAADTSFQATFEDAPASPPLYVAADSLSLREPEGVPDTPSDWRSGTHGADYVILSHPEFLDAAHRLAGHRRGHGLRVAVVSIEDVYDEFSFGRVQREAVADFIRHAYEAWAPRPAFVTLLGDATWDYRGVYTGKPKRTLVPTRYYLARERGFSPSDYHLALVDGDDLLADLSVGRLAVDSAEEAERVVDKIIAYDTSPEPGDWRSRSVFAANWHAKDEFSGPLDSLAARYTEPAGLQSVRIYAPDEAPLPNPRGKAFLDALNDGALIVNFSGHGAAGAMQYLFSTGYPDWEYLNQVRNGGRLPLMMALSCLNGLFTLPRVEALSELMTEHEEGGAIAFISATALSRTAQNRLLSDHLYSQLFAEDRLRFGPVLDAAKARVLAAHSSYRDVVETMQLIGDPAQELALPPGADYAAVDLAVLGGRVTTGATVTLTGRVRNNTRLGPDSLTVALLGEAPGADPDTLWVQRRGPFAGGDSLRVDWAVGDRRGPYLLSLIVDANDQVEEADESDNRFDLSLHILDARAASPLYPPDGGLAPAAALRALTPVDASGESAGLACEFALSTEPGFPDSATAWSGPVPARQGLAEHAFDALDALPGSPIHWRVRLVDGAVTGPWSAVRTFALEPSPPGAADGLWRSRGPQLLAHGESDGDLAAEGEAVAVSSRRPAFRPMAATREDGFTVGELDGAGIVATDGEYLYAKRWFNDPSTTYAGSDFFARIGTGFGGTERGQLYGFLPDSTSGGIAATCHSDGYLYCDAGQTFQLERMDPRTGRLDTVRVPDGLVDWKTGQVVEEPAPGQVIHALITSDGRYVYNVSMSSAVGMRVGWRVRVFEPQAGWRLVREFVAPPTETGFTYLWTDGILADGERLYLIEYAGRRRIRAVSALDGSFIDEWTSDQEETGILAGQYDWVNDKVWLADLGAVVRPGQPLDKTGASLFRYGRHGRRQPARLWSPPIGPAAAWGTLTVEGSGVRVSVQAPEEDGGWTDLPEGAVAAPGSMDLSGLEAERFRRLRLAALVDTAAGARLSEWQVSYTGLADLEVAAAEAGEGVIRAAVRNRGEVPSPPASLRLEARLGQPLRERRLPALPAGALVAAAFDSLGPLPAGARVRVLYMGTDADPGNDAFVLALQGPRLIFRAWPGGQRLQSGDALGTRALWVEADGPGRIELAVDGSPVTADSTWTTASGASALHRMAEGLRQVEARLVDDEGELAVSRIDLLVGPGLHAANVLVHPHPVRGEGAAFTFFLSREAEVGVDMYALGGRRIRSLGPAAFEAGFGQLPWDGRDEGGRPLASGTYLYVLTATAGGERVDHRAPVVLVR